MAVAYLERRLLAIVAADVVGYSRLMEADEAGTIARLRATRAAVLEPLVARHHGRIVSVAGDVVIITYESVVGAVCCAVAIQRAMAARREDGPEARQFVLRIGINLGDVAIIGDEVYGDGVNVAARLQQLCEPGGVLVSGTAYDHLQGRLDLPLDFAGEQRVKNISRPVRTYQVRLDGASSRPHLRRRGNRLRTPIATALLGGLAAAIVWRFWPWDVEPPLVDRPAVAVGRLAGDPGDAEADRVAVSLAQDVMAGLARSRDVNVVAPASSLATGGVAAARVGYLLEGSIQHPAGSWRATVWLVETAGGTRAWSDHWDRPSADPLVFEAELAERLAATMGGLGGVIAKLEQNAAQRKQARSLTAYDLYMRGLQAWSRDTRHGMEAALELLHEAVDREPRLERAWVVLALAYGRATDWADDPTGLKRTAQAAGRYAVQLDPLDPLAHAALAQALAMGGDRRQAALEFAEALRLNPDSVDILAGYAGWAADFDQAPEGAAAADRAVRLVPDYPVWTANMVAYGYFMTGRYEDAARTLARIPDESRVAQDYIEEASSLAALGRADEARLVVAKGLARLAALSIERHISRPDFTEAERVRYVATMRVAGFPACGREEDLKGFAQPHRLPECEGTDGR